MAAASRANHSVAIARGKDAETGPIPVDQNRTVLQQKTHLKYGVVTINGGASSTTMTPL
jgi:hypothetical protein